MKISPKHCPRCKKQGLCTDTRKQEKNVRRRYTCQGKCGLRWSTYEFSKSVWLELKQERSNLKAELDELKYQEEVFRRRFSRAITPMVNPEV